MKAWLIMPDGAQVDVGPNCQIGRMAGCAIRIESVEVSRRHAFIHVQQSEMGTEFWLADLGSTNGTIRNGRRITIPCRLADGDSIVVGDATLVFRQDDAEDRALAEEQVMMTVPLQAARICWLVMLDIKNFTQITHTMAPDALGQTVGRWLRRTRDAVESAGGVVDKFLGDAIFAYWEASPGSDPKIAGLLQGLQAMQAERAPDFRIVVHLGPAMLAGGAGGANNVSGLEVIYVFRIEKVGSRLSSDSVVSAAAQARLAPFMKCESVGSHELDGFTGARELFKLPTAGPADTPPHK